MAGNWIKWIKGLTNRREVVILSSKLGRDRHEIAGRLMVLWEWCDDNTKDEDADESLNVSLNLGDKPFDFLDALLGLPGMAEAMASTEVRWLEVRSGGRIVFPKLARHNGTSAKTRAYEALKKSRQRERPESVPEMSRNNGDKTGTREEKRREEIKDPPNPPFDFPPELQTVAFRSAWDDWIAERRSQKRKPYTDRGARSQLNELAKHGEAKAIAAIRASIRNGWAGLFPEKTNASGSDRRSDRFRADTPTDPAKYTAEGMARLRAGAGAVAGQPAAVGPPDGASSAEPSAGQAGGSGDDLAW